MSEKKQFNMIQGNAAISVGNYEGFLALCINDTVWEFVGDRTIGGKKAVREYLNETYMEPPKFNVKDLIARANL